MNSPDNNKTQNMGFTFFWHTSSPFSQWHPSLFTVKGRVFSSAEQFMMYCKAKLFQDEVIAEKILLINVNNSVVNEFVNTNDGSLVINSQLKLKGWGVAQKEIKSLGRQIKNFSDQLWDRHKENYVYRGSCEKYQQNPKLKEILIAAGNTFMVEASPYDKVWGIGMKKDHPNTKNPAKWQGLNLLGNILTKIKNEF
jgi:predicted NAD-dependent protein-ADP-ribosyltransferase YbiA (DUF1768 family)